MPIFARFIFSFPESGQRTQLQTMHFAHSRTHMYVLYVPSCPYYNVCIHPFEVSVCLATMACKIGQPCPAAQHTNVPIHNTNALISSTWIPIESLPLSTKYRQFCRIYWAQRQSPPPPSFLPETESLMKISTVHFIVFLKFNFASGSYSRRKNLLLVSMDV